MISDKERELRRKKLEEVKKIIDILNDNERLYERINDFIENQEDVQDDDTGKTI